MQSMQSVGVILVRIFPGFSRILSEYLSVFSPNAGKSRKNAEQNNSKYGLFLRRGIICLELINSSVTGTKPISFNLKKNKTKKYFENSCWFRRKI